MYSGVDLAGWQVEPGQEKHWQAKNWILDFDGKGKTIWTGQEFGDFVLVCDWRWTAKPVNRQQPVVLPDGESAMDEEGKVKTVEVLDAGDSGIYLRGSSKSQVNIWCWPIGSGEVYGYRTDKKMPLDVRKAVTPTVKADAPLGNWNRFIITMKGDRLNVELNGETVINNARLPGVPERGWIALQSHGAPIQFANLLIKELD